MNMERAIQPTEMQVSAPVNHRLRVYGIALIVALSFLVFAALMNEYHTWVPVYFPVAGLVMVMVCLTGAEFRLYTTRVAAERRAQVFELGEAERHAIARQRTFNQMWQKLADSHGQPTVPEEVLKDLADLFSSDVVAFWSADTLGKGFSLRGTHPLNLQSASRLDKIAQVSPVFDELQAHQQMIYLTDIARQSTPAMAWYCEENKFKQAILCPVLVRSEVVGVLAFFYQEQHEIPASPSEEMRAAANLFLCYL
jgi:hypothetical protein